MKYLLHRLFPFLNWFPMSRDQLRGDLTAGITVSLVLVPQSMAYAQLAGLPVVYGLYASFIPVIVASLWGSLSQLHTGPVAMLSLMSAAALMPFATPGTPDFVQLSIMLALMVGVLRLALGVFRLGVVVNFLSSPVIVGFTNAAALIIGLSLLSKVIGVPFPRSDNYLADLWNVVLQIPQTHLPTLLFALATWAVIRYSARWLPKLPGVLVAVAAATLVSWAIGFETKVQVPLDQIQDPDLRAQVEEFREVRGRIDALTARLTAINSERRAAQSLDTTASTATVAAADAEISIVSYEIETLKQQRDRLQIDLYAEPLTGVAADSDGLALHPPGGAPDGCGRGRTQVAVRGRQGRPCHLLGRGRGGG